MNKNIRNMSHEEVLNIPTLGLDDSFEFSCKACGKCCKNRTDLILTPYDLFRIADYFGRTPQEVFDRYCEVYIGSTSQMPIVRVVPVPPNNSCPFMRNRKCSVHGRKPVVCRVFPLARLHYADGYGDGSQRFYVTDAGCNYNPKSVTVREHIADVASDEAAEAGSLWMECITAIYQLVEKTLHFSTDTRDKINSVLFGALYLAYDMEKPFVPQLRHNIEQLKVMFEAASNGALTE